MKYSNCICTLNTFVSEFWELSNMYSTDLFENWDSVTYWAVHLIACSYQFYIKLGNWDNQIFRHLIIMYTCECPPDMVQGCNLTMKTHRTT